MQADANGELTFDHGGRLTPFQLAVSPSGQLSLGVVKNRHGIGVQVSRTFESLKGHEVRIQSLAHVDPDGIPETQVTIVTDKKSYSLVFDIDAPGCLRNPAAKVKISEQLMMLARLQAQVSGSLLRGDFETILTYSAAVPASGNFSLGSVTDTQGKSTAVSRSLPLLSGQTAHIQSTTQLREDGTVETPVTITCGQKLYSFVFDIDAPGCLKNSDMKSPEHIGILARLQAHVNGTLSTEDFDATLTFYVEVPARGQLKLGSLKNRQGKSATVFRTVEALKGQTVQIQSVTYRNPSGTPETHLTITGDRKSYSLLFDIEAPGCLRNH